MSLYAQAMQSGVQAITTAFEGGKAAEAFYTNKYLREDAISRNKVNAERNITAIKQDTIRSNTQIQMKQDQAEAMAKVSAAAAGVTGGSVSDVLYTTEVNEVNAMAANEKRAENSIASEMESIYASSNAMFAEDTVQQESLGSKALGNTLQAVGSLDEQDFENFGSLWGN